MNPLTLNGQIEGGIVQGLGWALAEQIHHEEGVIAHADFESQLNPTSLDVSEIESVIVESPDVEGPFGAKGAGEMPLIPAAPAIAKRDRRRHRGSGQPEPQQAAYRAGGCRSRGSRNKSRYIGFLVF